MSTTFDPLVNSSVAFSAGLWMLDDWLQVDPAEAYIALQVSKFLDGAAARSLYGMNIYEAFLNGLEYGLRRRGYDLAAETLCGRQESVRQPERVIH